MGSLKKLNNERKKNINKLTEEELKNLQEKLTVRHNIKNHIADLEIKKYDALKALDEADMVLQTAQKNLKDKYGDVNINVQTGEITEKPNEQKPN